MALKPLKDASQKWTPAVETHGEPLVVLAAAWARIVGKDIARHSRPIEINGDTLLIATRSSSWTQQLSFLGDDVLLKIAEHMHIEGISKIRFRVGRMTAPRVPGANAVARSRAVPLQLGLARPPAVSLDEALANFRAGVEAAQRAKLAAGWKDCRRCGLPVARGGSAFCLRCVQAQTDARVRTVARLLFEAPWLGYAGVCNVIKDLSEREYESICRRVLARWWETLSRASRAGQLTKSGRERLIASSYVILKSGLDPEQISPAVVRNLLGDDLHELIYGTVNS